MPGSPQLWQNNGVKKMKSNPEGCSMIDSALCLLAWRVRNGWGRYEDVALSAKIPKSTIYQLLADSYCGHSRDGTIPALDIAASKYGYVFIVYRRRGVRGFIFDAVKR